MGRFLHAPTEVPEDGIVGADFSKRILEGLSWSFDASQIFDLPWKIETTSSTTRRFKLILGCLTYLRLMFGSVRTDSSNWLTACGSNNGNKSDEVGVSCLMPEIKMCSNVSTYLIKIPIMRELIAHKNRVEVDIYNFYSELSSSK